MNTMKALLFVLTLLLAPAYSAVVNTDPSAQVAHEVPCCANLSSKVESDGDEGCDEPIVSEPSEHLALTTRVRALALCSLRAPRARHANGIRAPPYS